MNNRENYILLLNLAQTALNARQACIRAMKAVPKPHGNESEGWSLFHGVEDMLDSMGNSSFGSSEERFQEKRDQIMELLTEAESIYNEDC